MLNFIISALFIGAVYLLIISIGRCLSDEDSKVEGSLKKKPLDKN